MAELVCAADGPRWLDERRRGVTATDITAITGLSPYESEYSLYWKKLGHIPDVIEDTPRLRLGRDLEPLIISRWKEASPGQIPGTLTGLWRNDARPWQLATPDDVLYPGPPGSGPCAVLEVKSWADADRHAWGPGCTCKGTGFDHDGGCSDIPPRVRAQVLWQMDTLDVAAGHVGVLFLPSGEFQSYTIEHGNCQASEASERIGGDPPCAACTDLRLMRAAGDEFMRRLSLELPPPSPDASSATLAALKARFADPRKDKEAEIDPIAWHHYSRYKKAMDEAEAEMRAGEALIREQAGDAGILTVAGVPVARHTISVVKAHQRKESRRDSITRIKNGETSE